MCPVVDGWLLQERVDYVLVGAEGVVENGGIINKERLFSSTSIHRPAGVDS